MTRCVEAKPYFRKQTKSWYFSTGGKQYPLGKDREEAFRKFHEMMAEKEVLPTSVATLYELSQVYLDWCQTNRSKSTYDRYLHYLKSFIAHVGRSLKVATLKPHHLTKWAQSPGTWNSTSQNDAMGIVQRMLNWAVEQGYIQRSPLPRLAKPKRQRREAFYTDEQWTQICEHVHDDFIDLLDFPWDTGCRPKEARALEARHVHLEHDLCLYTHKEAKGEEVERMNGTAGEFAEISAAANLAGMAAFVFVMRAGEKSNRGLAGLHGSLSFSLAGPFLEGCVC